MKYKNKFEECPAKKKWCQSIKKNPYAAQSLRGAIYEDKIINLFKSKISMNSKTLSSKEAEKIISDFTKPKESATTKAKSKKISKK